VVAELVSGVMVSTLAERRAPLMAKSGANFSSFLRVSLWRS
jgi:hypothetical protein